MIIEEIRIKNFKALKDVHLTNLPPMAVFVGKNGTGKTTLFHIFAFLKNCLASGVRTALQVEGGLKGFREVITRGCDPAKDTIEIILKFRLDIAGVNRLVTYLLEIGIEENKPVVLREILRYKRGAYGSPFHFLDFSRGEGRAVNNEEDFREETKLTTETQSIAPDSLAISSLGQLDRFKAAKAFRDLLTNWHISDFHISDARGKKMQEEGIHLSSTGNNLPSVAYRLKEEKPELFAQIIEKMRTRVPGVANIEATVGEDGSLLVRYADAAFKDPFLDHNVSDGTIKMFAYMVLLHDPMPHKILCVEEPENQLYPELLGILAEEFLSYAHPPGGGPGGQVFVSTHSPEFLNAVRLESLFVMEKEGGITKVYRVQDDPLVANFIRTGDLPGHLWNQGMFKGIGYRITQKP
jgi:predicted ATPase